MQRCSFPLLAVAVLASVAGCALPGETSGAGAPPSPPPSNVGVLVPLTGPNAAIGRDLLRGAQLALSPGGPQLDVHDTAGTPGGAASAASAAVAAHDGVIVGPLTAVETAAVAGVSANTPVLAFTSDRQQARPGVWVLGITPQQQAARLVAALAAAGRSRIAAVLPDNTFGDALADGLTRGAGDAGAPPPTIRRYSNGRGAPLDAALRDVSDYAHRRGAIDAQVRAARDSGDPDAASQAAALAAQPVPPAPFDALMLAESGPVLAQALAALPRYDIAKPDVQVVGPATWMRDAASVPALNGAWYAAPDPSERGAFEAAFAARNGGSPPPFADIAYDAARIAIASAPNPALLLRSSGYHGVDGPLALRADGTVMRGLAVFEVAQGKPRLIASAPALSPGS